jgi:uncharacterized protein DUF6283
VLSDLREPCKSCPYRLDAPAGLWHRTEFENLLAHDADPLHGAMFDCHMGRGQSPEQRQFCVGWLLDQKRRGEPSIQLRLRMRRDPALCEAMHLITDGGHPMYESIEAMAADNGAFRARLRPPNPAR